ncbi:hypothetical protein EVAR_4394_1 [Eumeta japonica]|uniref:Uncharacterized protein n=1 Tax=Eumeta variegata TaxID=151549 RepID=A0A4C1SXM5_EUMVA|nr:hypothetical protein EVAR_4394_1 [Eumeta japonica]
MLVASGCLVLKEDCSMIITTQMIRDHLWHQHSIVGTFFCAKTLVFNVKGLPSVTCGPGPPRWKIRDRPVSSVKRARNSSQGGQPDNSQSWMSSRHSRQGSKVQGVQQPPTGPAKTV